MALVSLPVMLLQILAASGLDAGGSSLMTVFNPVEEHTKLTITLIKHSGLDGNIESSFKTFNAPFSFSDNA